MIRRTLGMSAGVLLLVAASISGQDAEARKPLPFEFKVSGDTVETFKAEFKLNVELDQSSPEGVVKSYCLLADGRDELSRANEKAFASAWELVRKAEQPIRARLFGDEMQKQVAKAEQPEDRKRESGTDAAEVVGVSSGENGEKLVETLQKRWYMVDAMNPETGEPTGEKKKHEEKTRHRYTCVKGADGKWRINHVEVKYVWQVEGVGETEAEWEPVMTVLHYAISRAPLEKPAELKQDTPENVALSLFNHLLRQRAVWQDEIQSRALRGWVDALMPLFTEEGLKAPERKEGEGFQKDSKREVDFVSDDADGVKRVKFKQTSEWFGAVELYVKKEGDVWKIVKSGYYELKYDPDTGSMKEKEFVEEYNLEMLNWR